MDEKREPVRIVHLVDARKKRGGWGMGKPRKEKERKSQKKTGEGVLRRTISGIKRDCNAKDLHSRGGSQSAKKT